MVEKDYFGDDWVDDVPTGESQIEYPDDLLDESFGVEETTEKTVEVNSEDVPRRPKIGILGGVRADDYMGDNDVPAAGKNVPTFGTSFDEADMGDIYFNEAEVAVKKDKEAGSPVPQIDNIPNARIAPKRPTIDSSNTGEAENPIGEVQDEAQDLVSIITSGVEEPILTKDGLKVVDGVVDIDYDPDEEDIISEDDEGDDYELEFSDTEDEDETESEDTLSEDISEDVEEALVAGKSAVRKSTKKRKPGPRKKRGPKPGIRLTARDMQILTFLARYRVATVAQLARMFETSETALRNRLPRLEKEKLVSWAWGAQSKPKLWLITRQGLQVVNMTLTVPTVKWGQLRHTLGLTDLGIEFELAGEVVITEREIRAAATRYTPTARIKTAVDFMHYVKAYETDDDESEQIQRALTIPMANRSFGHIPDMVLARQSYPNGDSGNIAIELELNRKHTNEWVAVLTAYRDTNLFESVQYYTMNKEIKRALTAIIKALNAEDKIQIHYFVPIDNTADPLITGGK